MNRYLKIVSLLIAVLTVTVVFSACDKNGDTPADTSDIHQTETSDISVSIAENGEQTEGFYTYKVTNGTVVLTEYSGAESDITVPSEIGGMKVSKIGGGLFKKRYGINTVTIPEGITEIGEGAFSDCTALNSISVPSTVKAIGASAFSNTPWYSSLSDEFVTVGDGVVVKYNGNGGNVTIPANVRYVSNLFRYSDVEITHITLSEGTECIGQKAFAGLKSLTGITLPSTVKTISTGAFTLCTSLVEITVPETVTVIEEYAFSHCKSLETVTVNAQLEVLDAATFYGCSALKTVTFSDKIGKISADSLSSCPDLTTVYINGANTEISASAFNSTTGVTVICPEGSVAEKFCIDNNIAVNPQN